MSCQTIDLASLGLELFLGCCATLVRHRFFLWLFSLPGWGKDRAVVGENQHGPVQEEFRRSPQARNYSTPMIREDEHMKLTSDPGPQAIVKMICAGLNPDQRHSVPRRPFMINTRKVIRLRSPLPASRSKRLSVSLHPPHTDP
jgi:hypothetical protein